MDSCLDSGSSLGGLVSHCTILSYLTRLQCLHAKFLSTWLCLHWWCALKESKLSLYSCIAWPSFNRLGWVANHVSASCLYIVCLWMHLTFRIGGRSRGWQTHWVLYSPPPVCRSPLYNDLSQQLHYYGNGFLWQDLVSVTTGEIKRGSRNAACRGVVISKQQLVELAIPFHLC